VKVKKETRKFVVETLHDLMWYTAGMWVFGPPQTTYIWAAVVVAYLGSAYFLTAAEG
jgi:hypothetical protein